MRGLARAVPVYGLAPGFRAVPRPASVPDPVPVQVRGMARAAVGGGLVPHPGAVLVRRAVRVPGLVPRPAPAPLLAPTPKSGSVRVWRPVRVRAPGRAHRSVWASRTAPPGGSASAAWARWTALARGHRRARLRQ